MNDSNQYPPYPYYTPEDEDELSLVDLWNIVWKRKWPWLTFGPLFAIIGIYIAVTSVEIYRAETTLAPSEEKSGGGGLSALAGQFGGLASMAGINVGSGGSTENALATLRSRKFLIPFLTEEGRLKTLFPREWDEEKQIWLVSKKRRDTDNRPTDLEAYERFTKNVLKISEDKKSGLVTLAIEFTNPQETSIWANQLTNRLNTYLRNKAKAETESNLEYLKKQLKETQVLEIRDALYSLIESESKSAMLANAKEEYAFKVIDPAYTPEHRIRPKRAFIVLAAGMLGGFFGVFLCFILHFVDTAKQTKSPIN